MASPTDHSVSGDPNTSGLSWLRVVHGAVWAGILVFVVDLVLFLATAERRASLWEVSLVPRALLLSAGVGCGVGFLALVLLRLRRWKRPGAVVFGVQAGVVAAQVEVVLVRFLPAADHLKNAWPSLLIGLAVGIAVTTLCSSRPERGVRLLPGLLGLAGLVLGLVAWQYSNRPQEIVPRPVETGHAVKRVILIVADTFRADALSVTADGEVGRATPRLRSLSEQAFRFAAARSPAPWTLPAVCSLMTGLSPLVHGAVRRDSSLPDTVPTLAEHFAGRGYRTGAMGHNAVLTRNRRLDRGFDEFDFAVTQRLPGKSLGLVLLRGSRERDARQYEDADELVTRAGQWVDEHSSEDFFLWMHFYDSHLSYAPPTAFQPTEKPPPGVGRHFAFADFERVRGGYFVPGTEGREWIRSLYDGEVRFLDEQLGRFFDHLRHRGLYEDSLIVFTSDHGEEFWEHGGFEHGHTGYEELLRVPLLIKLPGQTAGAVVPRPVTLESIVPTLLTLCGLPYEPEEQSAGTLFDEAGQLLPTAEEEVLLATGTLYYEDRFVVLFDGWKYVRHLVSGHEELYDLDRDPGETVSRIEMDPERLKEARTLSNGAFERAREMRERLNVQAQTGGLSEAELEALRNIGYAH